jgi:hypothetical protein
MPEGACSITTSTDGEGGGGRGEDPAGRRYKFDPNLVRFL